MGPLTRRDDFSGTSLDEQLLPAQVLHDKLAAAQRLAERDSLVHHEVNANSFEEGVVFLLENDYDITGISVRLWECEEREEEEELKQTPSEANSCTCIHYECLP